MASLTTAAVVSLSWCILAIWVGPRIGFLDRPDDSSLKTHARPTVPLGGVGVFLGVFAAGVIEDRLDMTVFAAASIVLVLGLFDDRFGLSPGVRLGTEMVAGMVLMSGLVSPVGEPVRFAFGIFLVVLAINAVNLFDGLDGLASSVGLVTSLGLAWLIAARGGQPAISLTLAAALAGFLVVGWHPARVFLGDAGAYVVGLLLARSVLDPSAGEAWMVVGAASLLGVYALDLVVTLVRRRVHDRPLFEGDRSHLYDQLHDRGMSIPLVALAAALSQVILIVVAIVLQRWTLGWSGVLAIGLIYVLVFAALWKTGWIVADQSRMH